MTDTIAPEQLPHRFAEALNKRDLDLVDQFISGDTYRNHNPWVEDGRDNMKAAPGGYLDAYPDLKVTVRDVIVTDDLVIARIGYVGTQQSTYMGAEPTGQPTDMRSLDIWRVQDGVAVEHWDNVDDGFFRASKRAGSPGGPLHRPPGDEALKESAVDGGALMGYALDLSISA